jgi:hypothetical protein
VKTKIIPGDRVAVYGYFGRITGKVSDTNQRGKTMYFFVIEDGFYNAHNDGPFHEKQCRKLIKKRREK